MGKVELGSSAFQEVFKRVYFRKAHFIDFKDPRESSYGKKILSLVMLACFGKNNRINHNLLFTSILLSLQPVSLSLQ